MLKVCNIEQTTPCGFAMPHGSKGDAAGQVSPHKSFGRVPLAVRRAPRSEGR